VTLAGTSSSGVPIAPRASGSGDHAQAVQFDRSARGETIGD
jgi:hypothetical protein